MSLLAAIHQVWEESTALSALLPHERVFTGRIPSTKQIAMPYCAIVATSGWTSHRTDKTRYSKVPVSFHVWVTDNDLETGLTIAKAITDTYAETCFSIINDDKVIDVLDEGEPMVSQINYPTLKAWEVVQMFTFCLERQRVTHDECCLD